MMNRLLYLVGCAGIEPTTNGLKVAFKGYLHLFETIATIPINQALTSETLDK